VQLAKSRDQVQRFGNFDHAGEGATLVALAGLPRSFAISTDTLREEWSRFIRARENDSLGVSCHPGSEFRSNRRGSFM